MINQTKKQVFILAAIASIGLTSSGAFAQELKDIVVERNTDVIPYVIDGRNVVARSGFGLCWRTGFWSPAAAETALAGEYEAGGLYPVGCKCEKDIMPVGLCDVAPPEPEAPAPAPVPTADKIKLSADALFDFDKSVLKPEGRQILGDLASQAKQINLEVILAVGHTDRIGTDTYNQSLSERRAAAVKAFLIENGIDPSRVYTEGKGESQPVTGDDCKRGLARKALISCLQPDRRVEVEVIGTK